MLCTVKNFVLPINAHLEYIMLILSTQNVITRWLDTKGRDILFPQQEIAGKNRGGIPICAPQFGEVPSELGWRGIELPRHGLFRLQGFAIEEKAYSREGYECHQKVYQQPAGYPFDFTVTEFFRQRSEEGTLILDHNIFVERSHECSNSTPMPWRPGFHPYFATHGEEFEISVGRALPLYRDDRLEPAIVFDWFGQPVSLKTKYHKIDFALSGAKQVVVWAADKSTSVCLEMVAKDIRLAPGEVHCSKMQTYVHNRT